MFFPRECVGVRIVGLAVMTFDFLQNLVRTADVFVLDIQDRIDEVLVPQRADAVLPAEPGEEGAVVKSGLGIEVELRGPPGRGAVLELHPKSVEVIATALGTEGRKIFDLEVAGLFRSEER